MKEPDGFLIGENGWRVLILTLTCGVLALTVWCLTHGITIIFMHIYYFPIILLAYRYRWKGFAFCVLLSLAYVGLVMGFDRGDSEIILGAVFRGAVFVGIGAVIAYLSELLNRKNESEKTNAEKVYLQQQFQESVIANANVWISVLTTDGTPVIWNQAAEDISGYQKDAVLGRKNVWKQLYPDTEYRKKVTADIRRILGKDTLLENFETEIRCADGTIKIIVWNTKGLRDNSGIITRYISIGRDVTAQKAAELRVMESSRFLGTMIDTLPIPIFFKDAGGKYLGCNPPFEEYLGIRRDRIVGKSVYDLSPGDLADKYAAADQQMFDHPAPQRYEMQVQYADGSRHDVIFYKAPFFQKDGTLGGLIGTFLDITERKRIEEALRESESFNRGLIENLPEYLAVYGQDGNILYVNPASAKALGYDADSLVGTPVLSYVAENYHDTVTSQMTTRLKAGDISPYEVELVTKTGPRRSVIVKAAPINYRNNPAVLLLLFDITERKRSETALRESEEKYRLLAENATDIIWVLDLATLRFTYFSPSVEKIRGYAPEEAMGLSLEQTFTPEAYAKSAADLRQVIEQEKKGLVEPGRIRVYEYQERCKDGSFIFTESMMTFIRNAEGDPVSIQGITRDITERKRAEEALRESEEKYRSVIDNIQDLFYRSDDKGVLIMASPSLKTVLGYDSVEEALGKPITEFYFQPEERTSLLEAIHKNGSVKDFEITLKHKNGSPVPVATNSHFYYDKSGRVLGIEGVLRDITERKQAEDALLKAHDRTERYLKIAGVMLTALDRDGTITLINRKGCEILGREWQELVGQNWFDVALPADIREEVFGVFRKLMAGGVESVEYYENPVLTRSGLLRLIAFHNTVLREPDGRITGIIFSGDDITDKKRVEEQLRQNQVKLAAAMDLAQMVNWEYEVATGMFTFDDRFYAFYGTTAEREGGHQLSAETYAREFVYPEDIPAVAEEIRKILATTDPGYSGQMEHRIIRRDGEIRTIISRYAPIMGADGNVIKTQGANQDITERKQAEEARDESRQLFMDIISFLPDPTFVIDNDGKVIAWNRAIEQLSGVPAADIIGKADNEYSIWMYGKRRPILIDLVLHPDKDAARLNYTNIHWEGSAVTAQTEIARNGDGHKIPLSLVASPLMDAQGKITGAIESMRDISVIKEAEANLARFNANLEKIIKERTQALHDEIIQRRYAEQEVQDALSYTRSVIDANPDLMAVLDQKGLILDVNTATESMMGLPREQLIGTPYTSYIMENTAPRDIFTQLVEKGRLEYTIQLRRADGHITPLSVNSTLFRGKDATDARVIVAAHDITRQKLDEAAIRASLDEKVILLREIHHRVKNNLQIIISLTNLQMRQTGDPVARQIMAETQNRVRAMSLVHEKLYRSESLSRIDFSDYTRFLATQLTSFYAVDTRRVKLDLTMGKIMVDINTAVPLGLIMNELVSNALKHAFPEDRRGTISISGGYEGNLITIVVRDDGIGIPADLDWRNTESLGLRLINSLVDQVSGTLEMKREGGTMFIITLNRDTAPEGRS
ncbi:PAS domain S-box protein [uncultured Methanoregula sp.]|uniref:PAS domain S-box protein n=1 Tax=uncultured Methanoregula sp. TaxID=1005933 RepID=UPI002AAC10FB|nr:PAS domain S-box protein [uncultured Methanoregula sp.]